MHLVIEGRGGNWHKLQDLPALYELLDTLPGRINMTKIMPPIVTRYVGVSPEDWGISGFVMIAESHISVHTFPERGEVAIDVFSCKEFDPVLTCDILKEQFGLTNLETCVLRRGLEYDLDTSMLPTRYAHEVTAYTPDITKPDTPRDTHTALPGYHPNGYETNGALVGANSSSNGHSHN